MSARRRMLPSQAISVITTLTQASVPASARQRASYFWQLHESRTAQCDARYALWALAIIPKPW